MVEQEVYDAFLSYSRKDREFVQQCVSELRHHGKSAWVDWDGIEPSAEWWDKICGAIDEARAFVCVLSPASLGSEICSRELNRAIESGKRIIPLVCDDISGLEVSWEVSRRNYIFLRESDDFARGTAELAGALEVDPDYVDFHSRLGKEAQMWREKGDDASFLLRGAKLEEVNNWALMAGDREPKLSELHRRFIEASLTEVEREKERAIQSRKEALEMVSRVVGDLRESLEPVGQLGILEKADRAVADYFDGRPEGELLEEELLVKGRALLRRGEVLFNKGHLREAEDIFDDAIRIGRNLCELDPEEGDWRYLLAEGFLDKGDILHAANQLEAAKEKFEAALAEAKFLVGKEEKSDWLQVLSSSYNRLGNVYYDENRFEEAEKVYRSSLELCSRMQEMHPKKRKFAREVAVEKQALGNAILQRENREEARGIFEESLEILYGLLAAEPTNARWLADVSTGLKSLGITLLRTGRIHTGRHAFERSLDIVRDLIQRDDTNTDWKVALADRYGALGDTMSEPVSDVFAAGAASDPVGNLYLDLEAALLAYQSRLDIYASLLRKQPESENYALGLVESNRLIGGVLQKMGQLDRARDYYKRVLDLIQNSPRGASEDWRWIWASMVGNANMGHATLVLESARGALPWYLKSFEFAEKLRKIDAEKPSWAEQLAACFQNLGTVYGQINEIDAGRIEFERALEIVAGLAGKEPGKRRWLSQISSICVQAGSLEIIANDFPRARELYDRAMVIYDDLISAEPENPDWRRLAISARDLVAAAYKENGYVEEAGEIVDGMVQLAAKACQVWPGDSRLVQDLSTVYQKLADIRLLEAKPAAAEEAVEHSIDLLTGLQRKDPENERWAYFLGLAYVRLGEVVRLRDADEAGIHYEKALRVLKPLAGGQNRETYLQDTLRAFQQYSDHLASRGDFEKARELLEESIDLLGDGIPGSDAVQRKFEHLKASNYVRLGDYLKKESSREDAVNSYTIGLEMLKRLVECGDETQLNWQLDLVGTQLRLGDMSYEESRFDSAAESYESALELVENLLARGRSDLRIHDHHIILKARRASLYEMRGDWRAALEEFNEARNLIANLLDDHEGANRPDWTARLAEYDTRIEKIRDLQNDS